MGDFSDDYKIINVQFPPPLSGSTMPRWQGASGDGEVNALRSIQRAIDEVSSGAPRSNLPGEPPPGIRRGGTVYIPPGRYLLSTRNMPGSPTTANLVVPSDVMLQFAPGAVLIIEATVTVVIEGAIDAPLFQIFDPAPRSSSLRGPVLFVGDRVATVFPEWWGARGLAGDELGPLGFDSASAIQAALDAAHRDRNLIGYDGVEPVRRKARPPIPVQLSARYVVRRTLQVTSNASGFVLRGSVRPLASGVGDAALVGAFPPPPPGGAREPVPRAILFVRNCFGFLLEQVSFDVNANVKTALWIEHGDGATGGVTQMPKVSACGFRESPEANVLRELVHLGGGAANIGIRVGPLEATDTDRDRNANAADDLSCLNFEGCFFSMRTNRTPSGAAFPVPMSVRIRAANALTMQFTACFFAGDAKAFIGCASGTFLIDACTFHNVRRDGCDILLENPGNLPMRTPPAGAFTATHCESQSWCFLRTFSGASLSRSAWNVVLLGLSHANVNTPLDAAGNPVARNLDEEPPSIFWDAAGDGTVLVLVGCRCSADVVIGPSAAAVIDVGTVFFGNVGPGTRGGGFQGNLEVLRGIAGLPTARDLTTGLSLRDVALRIGARYLVAKSSEPGLSGNPDVRGFPWQEGDVWMQPPAPAISGILASLIPPNGDSLDNTLHRVWRDRSLRGPSLRDGEDDPAAVTMFRRGSVQRRSAWERVFGSEDYSGPWFPTFRPGVVTLDSDLRPVVGAVYELVWSMPPHRDPRGVRLTGRESITVSVVETVQSRDLIAVLLSGPVGAVAEYRSNFGPDRGGGIAVRITVEALFGSQRDARAEFHSVAAESLAGDTVPWRLRLLFRGVTSPPWEIANFVPWPTFRAVVRRLL